MWNHYALIDPRKPGEYRYVGPTRHTLKHRLSMHLNSAKSSPSSPVERWIVDLLCAGVKPEIINLSFGWVDTEELLIEHFRSEGHPLLNVCKYDGRQ